MNKQNFRMHFVMIRKGRNALTSNPFLKLFIQPIILFIAFHSLLLNACEEKMSEDEIEKIGITQQKAISPFVRSLGFDLQRTAFSSSHKNTIGIALIQLPFNAADSGKQYQHPSWDDVGYMGAITTDEFGNVYSAPIPVVNTLNTPFSTINRVYKIDALSGEMKLFSILPPPDSTKEIVPFGILGIYYDAHGKKLYASSVAGSTRDEEKGIIYSIDPTDGKIIEQFKGYDAMSLFVGGISGIKKLYFGSSRNSGIYSIELSKSGKFIGDAKLECSLEQLGPRGDDKARRIRFDKTGYMNITGVEFNYNLTANSNVLESFYQFGYDRENKEWRFIGIK